MAQPSGHLGKEPVKIYELHEDLKAWLIEQKVQAIKDDDGSGSIYAGVLEKIEELEDHYE